MPSHCTATAFGDSHPLRVLTSPSWWHLMSLLLRASIRGITVLLLYCRAFREGAGVLVEGSIFLIQSLPRGVWLGPHRRPRSEVAAFLPLVSASGYMYNLVDPVTGHALQLEGCQPASLSVPGCWAISLNFEADTGFRNSWSILLGSLMYNACNFLGHLSDSGDLLLWVVVCRRPSCVVR